MAWILRRVGSVQKLEWRPSSVGLQTLVEGLPQVPGGMAPLRGLHVSRCALTSEEFEGVMSSVDWILSHAGSLKYLRIDMGQFPNVSGMQNIKFLQFMATVPVLCQVIPELTALHMLETLCLTSNGEDAGMLHIDLASLGKLQCVALDNLVPSWIALPTDTTLHVTLWNLEHAFSWVWPVVSSNLRTFILNASEEKIRTLDEIPSILLQSSGLKTVGLNVLSFGIRENPIELMGALWESESLTLQAIDGLYVSIPQGTIHWTVVYLLTLRELEVKMADPLSFAKGCPAFFIKYDSLAGSDLIKLARFMGEHNQDFTIKDAVFTWFYWKPEDAISREMNLFNDHRCCGRCGACLKCCTLDSFNGH